MTYSLKTVLDAFVSGSPLIPLLISIVTILGLLGVKGHSQLIVSLVLGISLSAGYIISEVGVLATFGDWFYMTMYALAAGVTPTGLYETVKKLTVKR